MGLWTDREGQSYWRKVLIVKYLAKNDEYQGFWEKSGKSVCLPGALVRFDHEESPGFLPKSEEEN